MPSTLLWSYVFLITESRSDYLGRIHSYTAHPRSDLMLKPTAVVQPNESGIDFPVYLHPVSLGVNHK